MHARGGMLSVIIPAPEFSRDLVALRSLRAVLPAGSEVEILVATGRAPSAQRNLAIARARGDVLVFLDSDCEVTAEWWAQLQFALADAPSPPWDVMGGPLDLPPDAPAPQPLFQALLSHPSIVGRIASRYSRRGPARRCDDGELILANLVVRADLFRRIGDFHTGLYPNEENDWLDRAQAAGAVLWHVPSFAVRREQRATWREFALALLRYGRGRTEQFLLAGKFSPGRQLPPALLPLGLVALFLWPVPVLPLGALAWIGLAWILSDHPLRDRRSWTLGLTAPLVPLCYALGQWWGWFSSASPRATGLCLLVNENGQPR